MCRVQLKDRKISMDLMLILGLSETIDQLCIAVFIGMVMC